MVGSSSFSHGQYDTRSSQRNAAQQSSSTQAADNDRDDSFSPKDDMDAILEKKRKNASAQAAFRARRSTYIANLEETVISLETVIRKLQDACRDAHDDAAEFKDENSRLKALVSSYEERERIWKAYAKATAGTPAAMAATSRLSVAIQASLQKQHQQQSQLPQASSFQQAGGQVAGPSTPPPASVSPHQGTCYSEDSTVYGDDASGYGTHGSASYGKAEDCDGMRLYDSMAQGSSASYNQPFFSGPTTASGLHMGGSVPQTPASGNPPNEFGDITSMALVQDNGYIGPQNDYYMNVSPATSTSHQMPPQSALIPSYPDSPAAYTANKVTFATPDSSHVTGGDPGELALFNGEQLCPSSSLSTSGVHGDGCSDATVEGSSSASARARRHTYSAFPSAPCSSSSPVMSRRNTTGKSRSSDRSADPTALSNTLAVIKAQAFGNVRKTRARNKRSSASASAAKAAVEILEARGLSLGLDIAGGVKRRRKGEGLGGDDSTEL